MPCQGTEKGKGRITIMSCSMSVTAGYKMCCSLNACNKKDAEVLYLTPHWPKNTLYCIVGAKYGPTSVASGHEECAKDKSRGEHLCWSGLCFLF